MDALKVQLLKIQQQLSGLSASQKMLTASLVAIMVMTLLWWGRYAGTAELEAVFDQTLSAAEMGQIQATLDSHGITAKIVGDRVMVPADRKLEAVAMLAYSDVLPSNSSAAWDELAKQMSPWDSQSKTNSIQNRIKERMLSDIIGRFFPGVGSANVVINPVSERRVGASLEPSASVLIKSRGHDMDVKRLVDSAASTVASAVSGLTRSRVTVVIDGVTHRVADANGVLGSGELYEQIEVQEKRSSDKIATVSPPGTLIAVTVELETSSSQEEVVAFSKPNSIVLEQGTESTKEENNQPQPSAAEPGAQSNLGLSVSAIQVPNNASSTVEKDKTQNAVFAGKSTKMINTPAGKAMVVSAAVRVPRSYYISKYKAINPAAKDPDEKTIQAMFTEELPAFRTAVQKCVGLKDADAVSIDMCFDGVSSMMASASEGPSAGMGAMVGGHVREIALGALAVISLFMVSTIVKKGAPQPAIVAQAAAREAPRLGGSEDVAGIAGDGNATLDGMEMDEDTIKAQQMVEQVSTMVKENPDAAANLVKRWLNRT